MSTPPATRLAAPINQGGLAAQQADAVVAHVLRRLGAGPESEPPSLVLRGVLETPRAAPSTSRPTSAPGRALRGLRESRSGSALPPPLRVRRRTDPWSPLARATAP
jgi:hypothetical protein